MMKECLNVHHEGFAFPIQLFQRGKDSFRVVYGLQITDHLTYAQAATELGACIMHALALEGRLDNRMLGER